MIKLNQNNHCYFILNEIFSENEVIKSTEKKTIISFKNITGIPQEVCSDKPYFEGTVEKIIVNKYERNHKARQECLKHYGYKCCICDFNFLDKYGDIAKEIIEVHHLKKISSINSEYKVDPIKDLRPVCPNCHTVIHSREPIYEIVELKGIVNNRKN
jgi:predicted HNH restriction endonuclease